MLDGIFVEVYGSSMRLKDIASVTAPEPRMLLITPFDPQNSANIGKAIEKANIGLLPITEANLVRIKIPPMDESMRKEMVKQCQKRGEDAKVSVRSCRRDANEALKQAKGKGDLTEDLQKKQEKQVQDLTDKYCKECDDLVVKKESEISSI